MSRQIAAPASDKCTPAHVPTIPTVIPLNALNPSADILNRPITLPRTSAFAFSCTNVCAMLLNASSKNPATKSNASANG